MMQAFAKQDKLVIGDGETVDELQASGEWMETDDPVEVEP